MSILKNLFAAVGAVTLGAVAVGVVLGATTAMTADDDDFDLDELRDDAPVMVAANAPRRMPTTRTKMTSRSFWSMS